ncbi:hypothetical protein B0H13DRAFT_1855493 [Mycena leptocephala]|nr:hypothetical protein B0H13DRAFT_1855493 [Mycena leptocephala]
MKLKEGDLIVINKAFCLKSHACMNGPQTAAGGATITDCLPVQCGSNPKKQVVVGPAREKHDNLISEIQCLREGLEKEKRRRRKRFQESSILRQELLAVQEKSEELGSELEQQKRKAAEMNSTLASAESEHEKQLAPFIAFVRTYGPPGTIIFGPKLNKKRAGQAGATCMGAGLKVGSWSEWRKNAPILRSNGVELVPERDLQGGGRDALEPNWVEKN